MKGNLTDDGTFQYEYDAWNRLTKVKTQHDNLTLATYTYDALGRRIKKVVTNNEPFDGTTYFYYNKRWQMLESRDGSENLDTQVIYGRRYIDEIVRFEKKGKGTMFVFQDANWNVTGTVNYAAVPLDRLHTAPYGEPTFDAETINGDYDGDGDIDSSDDSNFTTCKNGSQPVTGACRVFDFDNDGDVDSADQTTFDTLYPGSTEIYRQPGRRTSANGFPYAHQGLMLDEETLTYYNRRRQYNPWQKRFSQRDPLALSPAPGGGYQDGVNLYGYLRSNPIQWRDPFGLGCRVRYHCTLVSQTGGCCFKNCEYVCRRPSNAPDWGSRLGSGDVDCEHPGIPPVRDMSRSASGVCLLCFEIKCAKCDPTAFKTVNYLWENQDLTRDCSRAVCRGGCDLVFDVANEACGLLPPVAKQVCQAAAQAAKELCISSCNAWCLDP